MEEEQIAKIRNVYLKYRIHRQALSKQTANIWALQGVDLNIYKGEKLGIIGRNGSGKSTLMKLITGIIDQDSGTVEFSKKYNIQLLTLGVGMEGSLTGRENALLNGMLLGRSHRYMLKHVEKIKEFSELGKFFDYPVNTYSSGMVARLGFSVAMESNPDVLLLDELLGVGDMSFFQKSQKALQDRFQSERTVVLISHDPNTISALCTRAVWLERGKIIMEGDPSKIMESYLHGLTTKPHLTNTE